MARILIAEDDFRHQARSAGGHRVNWRICQAASEQGSETETTYGCVHGLDTAAQPAHMAHQRHIARIVRASQPGEYWHELPFGLEM